VDPVGLHPPICELKKMRRQNFTLIRYVTISAIVKLRKKLEEKNEGSEV
jgi:hypothetical protein